MAQNTRVWSLLIFQTKLGLDLIRYTKRCWFSTVSQASDRRVESAVSTLFVRQLGAKIAHFHRHRSVRCTVRHPIRFSQLGTTPREWQVKSSMVIGRYRDKTQVTDEIAVEQHHVGGKRYPQSRGFSLYRSFIEKTKKSSNCPGASESPKGVTPSILFYCQYTSITTLTSIERSPFFSFRGMVPAEKRTNIVVRTCNIPNRRRGVGCRRNAENKLRNIVFSNTTS